MNVKAIVVDDIDSEEGRLPGAIEYFVDSDEALAGLVFRCPCGCGRHGALHFRMTAKPRAGATWQWDGNNAAPTLSPSVFSTGWPCKWHGWLRSGEWVSV